MNSYPHKKFVENVSFLIDRRFMYDYHTHTNFSDDSTAIPKEMIERAISLNVKELAITDHFDPDYPDSNFPFLIDFPKYYETLSSLAEEYLDRIKVVKGLEVGIQHGKTLEKCKNGVNSFSYDFIIGSFHCFNGDDLYTCNYEEMESGKIIPSFYEYMYTTLKEYSDFDVLGHINVIDRYVGNLKYFKEEGIPYYMSGNFKKAYEKSYEIIYEILKDIISKGKGIEVNTSNFRYGMKDRFVPAREILKLYKELGGEILTIGSDAHNPNQLCDGFDLIKEYLLSEGFKYQGTYSNRNIKMVSI